MIPNKRPRPHMLGLFYVAVLAVVCTGILFYTNSTSTLPLSLHIPTYDEIQANGYPVNENGETYGPRSVPNVPMDPGPDLILAINEDGIEGYIRQKDLSHHPRTVEEALAVSGDKTSLIMYYQDGITPIGTFSVGSHSYYH